MSGTVTLHERFKAMVHMRAFEEACAGGVSTGELRGELHLAIGQESVAAAMLGTLCAEDWVVGTHRSHPVLLAKGVDPYLLMAEIFEKGSGLSRGKGGHLHLFSREQRFSTTGIVGSSLPVALGHAYACVLEGGSYVAVAMTGDGGTNTGQFYETLNMAAIWELPLVVVVENNGYGISVPAPEVVAGAGTAARAAAFDVPATCVAASNVEAVAESMRWAVGHARSDAGPAVVEVVCDRHSGHYEGDPDHYRSKEAKERMHTRDPVTKARDELVRRDGFTNDELDADAAAIHQDVDALLARVRADEAPAVSSARTGVFVEVGHV